MSYINARPYCTAREIALAIDITERSTRKIISDLEKEGYISKTRAGRRNQYQIYNGLPLRHSTHSDVSVGKLLEILKWKKMV